MVVALRDGAARHDATSAPELLHDGLTVDGQRQRLLHERVVQRRPLAVHPEHVEAPVEGARHPRGRVAGHPLALVGRELGDDVHLALEQGRDARRRLRDRPHGPAVDLDLAAPVVGVGLEHRLVVLHPGAEAHRAGADGLGVEGVVADRLEVLLRHDLPAVEREPRGQQRIRLLGRDHERVRVRRLDLLDRGEHGGHHGLGGRVVGPLDAGLGVGGGERITVVELHALPQLEPPRGLAVELPLGGEAGVQLAVRMPARQVVEDVEGHPDIVRRGAEVRVELGDVARLGGHQLLLLGGLGQGGAGRGQGHRGGGAEGGRSLEQVTSGQFHSGGSSSDSSCIWTPFGYRGERRRSLAVRHL